MPLHKKVLKLGEKRSCSFQIELSVVEIDDAIIRVAKDQFGFSSNDKTKVFHQDGIHFVENFDHAGNCFITNEKQTKFGESKSSGQSCHNFFSISYIHAKPEIRVLRSSGLGIRCLKSLDCSLIAKESKQDVTIFKYIKNKMDTSPK